MLQQIRYIAMYDVLHT